MRHQGRITTWNDDKGFGFITRNNEGTTVFVHVSAFRNRQRRPVVGELVTYAVTRDEKDRRRAVQVAFIDDRRRVRDASTARTTGVGTLIAAILFMALVVIAAVIGRLPWIVAGFYALASLVTFFAYGFDKAAARTGNWRTKESTLHLFALIGGWPGAAFAQYTLRHKSRKTSFRVVFWLTVLIHCTVAGWLYHSRPGAEALARFLHTY